MPLLTNKTIEKLQHDLVRYGLIDFEQLTFAQENAEKKSSSLAFELITNDFLKEKDLLNFIQDKLHIPFVELNDYTPDTSCLKYLSSDNAIKYNILPLFRIEDVLTIAMSDPLDLFTIDSLFQLNNISIEPVVCSEVSIKNAIKKYYINDNKIEKWQGIFLTDNLTDELMQDSIASIFHNAIKENINNIYFEKSSNGINVFFDKSLQGFIPNLLVARFMFLFSNFTHLDLENEDIIKNSKFFLSVDEKKYSVFISYFPLKYGVRISATINKPIMDIILFDDLMKKLPIILEKPSIIQLKEDEKKYYGIKPFMYALADYISLTHSVLLVEEHSAFLLDNVAQFETFKNTAIYFDELLKVIEMQKFDVIFFEKIYTKEQYNKLKLLSSEYSVFVKNAGKENLDFDYTIDSSGVIN